MSQRAKDIAQDLVLCAIIFAIGVLMGWAIFSCGCVG